MQKLYFLKYSLISILLSVMFRAEAQSNDLYYRSAQNRLTNMLSGKESLNLREAIYCVENAWFNDKLNKKLFYKQIERYADFCRAVSNSGRIIYSGNDVSSVNAQAAVFAFMTDTIPIQMGDSVYYHLPFGYNADDFAGEKTGATCLSPHLWQPVKVTVIRCLYFINLLWTNWEKNAG